MRLFTIIPKTIKLDELATKHNISITRKTNIGNEMSIEATGNPLNIETFRIVLDKQINSHKASLCRVV
jgi:hypothetical protein